MTPVPDPDSARRSAYRRGRWAERLCRWLLRCKGYRILEANYRSPLGEIDIIARQGEVLVVVEVKARPTHLAASEAITPRQRARLARAATAFLSRNPHFQHLSLRFDVILVAPWRWPLHVIDAWRT